MTTAACEPGVPGAHHWVIKTADRENLGPTSTGRCLNGGWVKEHENSIEATQWSGNTTRGDQHHDEMLALAKKGNKLDTEEDLSELELAP